MAAGLTLGLTSIDEFQMKVLCNSEVGDLERTDTPKSRKSASIKLQKDQHCARRILPVISGRFLYTGKRGCIPSCLAPTNSHYLLVSLLLVNAMANEALPVLLDRLVPAYVAVLVSVTVVLVFGEIVPSALFTGPQQLALASAMVPVVTVLKFVVLPIAWPISIMLDRCLAHEDEGFDRARMKALVRTLRAESSDHLILEHDEANMIHGVLEMHNKSAQDIACHVARAHMLPHDVSVDEECIRKVCEWGHSRLFVYRRDPTDPNRKDDIIGVVLVKHLLSFNIQNGHTVFSLDSLDAKELKKPAVLAPHDNLLVTLNKFQAGMCHLAIVSEKPEAVSLALEEHRPIPEDARPKLFCSLEDVIEAMLKEEIYDEEDAEREIWAHAMSAVESLRTSQRSRSKNSLGKRSRGKAELLNRRRLTPAPEVFDESTSSDSQSDTD
mmetsp:Transcript_98082/g.199185  ORF Transcript_98082/g.199185 Transcript_98082/m.199185 type:complete len:439 (+) Transcript_98082:1-1317(+)